MKDPRRIQTTLNFEELADCLTGRRALDLPQGAQITDAHYDCDWWDGIERDPRLVLSIEHESFEAVTMRIPQVAPCFITRLGDNESPPKKKAGWETGESTRKLSGGGTT